MKDTSKCKYMVWRLKLIYFEKATKFCQMSTVDVTGTTEDKSTVEISQNFVAFSEYMNFNIQENEIKDEH